MHELHVVVIVSQEPVSVCKQSINNCKQFSAVFTFSVEYPDMHCIAVYLDIIDCDQYIMMRIVS